MPAMPACKADCACMERLVCAYIELHTILAGDAHPAAGRKRSVLCADDAYLQHIAKETKSVVMLRGQGTGTLEQCAATLRQPQRLTK